MDTPDWVAAAEASGRSIELPRTFRRMPRLLLEDGAELSFMCTRGVAAFARDEQQGFGALEPFVGLDEESAQALSLALVAYWVGYDRSVGDWETYRWCASFVERFPSVAIVDAIASRLNETHNRNSDLPGFLDMELKTTLIDLLTRSPLIEALHYLVRFSRYDKKLPWDHLVESALERTRKRLGVDQDELEDRSVPTFGLDARGGLDLDYGPRTIRLSFERGEALFTDTSDGRVFEKTPRKRKSDDAELVRVALEGLSARIKEFKRTYAIETERLQAHARRGRTWTLSHMLEFALPHPLLGPLLRGVVWRLDVEDGAPRFARVDEEGVFLDVDLEPTPLDGVTSMRVADIGELDGGLHAWAQHMSDFEIVQVIDQLGAAT